MGVIMKNSVNGSALKSSGILERDASKSKKFSQVYDWIISNAAEQSSILKDKELILMSSLSIVWFFAFFYFVLFVFT